eukprot:SAG11_NODE_1354_length_5128_cov_3.183337_6_plen_134_part_00
MVDLRQVNKRSKAAVGVEIRARLRQCVLPQVKVEKYTAAIVTMEALADSSKKNLAPRELVETALGRGVHSCDAIPALWIVLIALVALILKQSSFQHFIKFNPEMRWLLTRMMHTVAWGERNERVKEKKSFNVY